MKNILVAAFLTLAFFIMGGCSSSTQSPVSPELSGKSVMDSPSNIILWGLSDVSIDPETSQAEIVPLRGVEFTANVTLFMQPPSSPIHRMGITIDNGLTQFDTGYVVVDVHFTHPFAGLDLYTGFDVRGICIGNGSEPLSSDSNIIMAGENDIRVLNPDGYTRWFNPTEFTTYGTIFGFIQGKLGTPSNSFTATLNAYRYFCDGLDKEEDVAAFFADDANLNPRGYFKAGSTNTRRYEIQFPVNGGIPEYKFQYAVIASWEDPGIPQSEIEIPDSFSISSNCLEAYTFSIDDNSSLYYVDGTSNGGTLSFDLRIFDHQGGVLSTGVSSEIAGITIEAQGMLIDGNSFREYSGGELTGMLITEDALSATFHIEETDIQLTNGSDKVLMITVKDHHPDGYHSGYPGFTYPDGELSAYFKTTIPVGDTKPISVTGINPTSGNLDTIISGANITGTGFLSGASVRLENVDTPSIIIDGASVNVNSPMSITCSFDLDSGGGAVVGFYDVIVENPGGASAKLVSGFEIVEYEFWWKQHQYSADHLGYNPSATTGDPSMLTQDWSVSVPAALKYCTPLVVKDKIYFTSNNSFYASTTMRINCYSLTNGAYIWDQNINLSGYTDGSTRTFQSIVYHEGTDGIDRVVTSGDRIYCFNANTGATLWTYDVAADDHWYGTQIVIVGDEVFTRSRRYADFYSIDIYTGANAHSPVDLSGGGEGGLAVKNGMAYIMSGSNLVCVDIEAESIKWSTPLSGPTNHWNNPTIDGDRLYTSTYYGFVYCIAIADDTGPSPDYYEGDMIWVLDLPTVLVGGVVKYGDLMYMTSALVMGGDTGRVYCVRDEGLSASIAWEYPTGSTNYFDATPTLLFTPSYPNGVLSAPNRYGNWYFLDAQTGTNVHQKAVSSDVRAGVSVAGDYLVVLSTTTLARFSQ